MLELDLPIGSQWKIKLDVSWSTDMHQLGSSEKTRMVLQGGFTMKDLPPAKTFAEFFAAYPSPNPLDLDLSTIEQWQHNVFQVAYSGIQGEAEGFFYHSDSGGTWGTTDYIGGINEALPEMKYPISSIIRGGFWLDGIALWFCRTEDIFTKPFHNTGEAGWYFERNQKSKSWVTNNLFPVASEKTIPRKVGLTVWGWPGDIYMPSQLIQYSNEPQHFSMDIGPRKTEVEILLTSRCPYFPGRYTIVTSRNTPAWTPNNLLNSQAIAHLRGSSPVPGKVQLGRTLGDIPKPVLEVDWDGAPSNNGNDQVCLWVDKIEVTQYTGIELYIASELSPGSCPYSALLAHEDRHAKNYTDNVDNYLIVLKERLLSEPNIPSKSHPLHVAKANMDTERLKVEKLIGDIVGDHYKACLKQIDTLNNAIESPAEYAKVHASCPETDWP